MKNSLVILCLFISLAGFAQQEFFSEAGLEKAIFSKNRLSVILEGNYKHAYQDSKWRRLGIDIGLQRKLNSNWMLVGGIINHYRFDKELGNFYELRPKVGLQLSTPIIKNLSLKQRILGEWRNFFLSKHQHYLRARYKIALTYNFGKHSDSSKSWSLLPSFEWYFLKDPISQERYSNSREFSCFISRNLKEVKIMLGYIREVFLFNSDNFGTEGNTISLRVNL